MSWPTATRGGALLRLDRQHREIDRREALRAALLSPPAQERALRDECGAHPAPRRGRQDDACWPRGLAGEARRSGRQGAALQGTPGHPRGAARGSVRLEGLPRVPGELQARPRRLDRCGAQEAGRICPAPALLRADDRREQAFRDGAVSDISGRIEACWQRLVRSADYPSEAGMGATHVDEVADGIYRINTAVEIPDGTFSFNQYLIADDEPLLFHSGPRRLFASVRDAVARVLPLERLRFVGFPHHGSEEGGALNDFLAVAPRAEPVCGRINALV